MKAVFILLILLHVSGISMAQKKTYTLEEIKQIPKDSLIKMAVKILNDPTFSTKYYDRTKIRSGIRKYDSTEYFEITFYPSLLYIPKRSYFYSSVTVDMLKGSFRGGSIQGKGRSWEVPYYKTGREYKRACAFVIKAINKSDKVGSLPQGKIPAGSQMEIEERAVCYSVRMDSSHTASFYKVHKLTGKIYGARHKHKAGGYGDDDEL